MANCRELLQRVHPVILAASGAGGQKHTARSRGVGTYQVRQVGEGVEAVPAQERVHARHDEQVLRCVGGGHLQQRNRDHVRSEALAVTAAAVIGAAGAAHPSSREPAMLLAGSLTRPLSRL